MRAYAKSALIALTLTALALATCAGIAFVAWADEVDQYGNPVPAEAGDTQDADNVTTDDQAAKAQAAAREEKVKAASESLMGNSDVIDLGSGNNVNPQQLPDSSFIYDATIADLAGADSYLEGQSVQVIGEVVGDRINAELDPSYCWIVLADSEDRTVSVYMPKSEAGKIDTYGRYGQVGTQLQVRGEFRLVCSDHEGQTDIHASRVSVIKKGMMAKDEFTWENFIPGLILVAIGLGMGGVFRFLKERSR